MVNDPVSRHVIRQVLVEAIICTPVVGVYLTSRLKALGKDGKEGSAVPFLNYFIVASSWASTALYYSKHPYIFCPSSSVILLLSKVG